MLPIAGHRRHAAGGRRNAGVSCAVRARPNSRNHGGEFRAMELCVMDHVSSTPWTAAQEFLATLPEIAEVPRGKERVTELRRWLTKLPPHVEYLTQDAPAFIIETATRMFPADA